MKKIPLKEETRKRQNKIRKIVAAGLPLFALMTGLAGCSSGEDLPPPTMGLILYPPDLEVKQVEVSRGAMPKPIPMNVYVVQEGDTLSSIARKYGTTVAELKKLNDMTDEQIHMIRIGQKIKYK